MRRWMKETDRGGKGYVDYSDYQVVPYACQPRPRPKPPPGLDHNNNHHHHHHNNPDSNPPFHRPLFYPPSLPQFVTLLSIYPFLPSFATSHFYPPFPPFVLSYSTIVPALVQPLSTLFITIILYPSHSTNNTDITDLCIRSDPF